MKCIQAYKKHLNKIIALMSRKSNSKSMLLINIYFIQNIFNYAKLRLSEMKIDR